MCRIKKILHFYKSHAKHRKIFLALIVYTIYLSMLHILYGCTYVLHNSLSKDHILLPLSSCFWTIYRCTKIYGLKASPTKISCTTCSASSISLFLLLHMYEYKYPKKACSSTFCINLINAWSWIPWMWSLAICPLVICNQTSHFKSITAVLSTFFCPINNHNFYHQNFFLKIKKKLRQSKLKCSVWFHCLELTLSQDLRQKPESSLSNLLGYFVNHRCIRKLHTKATIMINFCAAMLYPLFGSAGVVVGLKSGGKGARSSGYSLSLFIHHIPSESSSAEKTQCTHWIHILHWI